MKAIAVKSNSKESDMSKITTHADAIAQADAILREAGILTYSEALEALRTAYADIQRLPGHTIDMLGRHQFQRLRGQELVSSWSEGIATVGESEPRYAQPIGERIRTRILET